LDELMGEEVMGTSGVQKVLGQLVFVAMIAGPAGPKLQGRTLTVPGVDPNQGRHQEVIQFLDLLKAGRAAVRKFKVADVPNWDVKRIEDLIYPDGCTIEDVNTKLVKKYSPAEVERALVEKKGDIFKSFSHVSFLYAKGMKQYSEVKFIDRSGGVTAVLATWYELEFVVDGARLKLKKCKYVNSDKD
jgi:hypothetical protein